MKYANVIVDISIDKLDKTFQYRIPEELEEKIAVGVQVDIPFGRRTVTGYVTELTDQPEIDVTKIRPLNGVHEGSVAITAQLVALAGWIQKNYGSTMNQALKTVIPVRRKIRQTEHKRVRLLLSEEQAAGKLALFEEKKHTAKARLLRELIAGHEIDYTLLTGKLNIAPATIRGMEQQ